jgi:hypothetical protein
LQAQEIVEFRIFREDDGGRTWLRLGWSVTGVNRVRLFESGREIASRIQLPNGSFGWPAEMPDAFRLQGADGDFTLVAEGAGGRVSARGTYGENGCMAWLSPPDRHWQRCRVGGVIASNLRPAAAGGASATCSGEGRVRSMIGFSVDVPESPLIPNSPTQRWNLDSVLLYETGTQNFVALPIRRLGAEGVYRFSDLQGGRSYQIALDYGWQGDPGVVDIRCPDRPGDTRLTARPLRATRVISH